MSELIEFRVRPVTRYIVTRFENDGNGACGGSGHGEFDNYETAHAVAYALCKADHERKGWPLDDDRIQYPKLEIERLSVAGTDYTALHAVPIEGNRD
jgi:hypothetical protein